MPASHTFTVLSQLPEAMRLPSGLNATLGHLVGVSLEGEDFLAGGGVPHLHFAGLVISSGPCDKCLPSGLKATWCKPSTGPPLKKKTFPAGSGVPNPHRPIQTVRNNSLVIGADRDTYYG